MSKISVKPILNESNILCEYGCGRRALFLITKREKYCCSNRYEKCPEQRRKNTERQIGNIPWNKGLTKEDLRVNKNTTNANKTRNQLIKDGKLSIWNKGLTKEDPRVNRYSIKIKTSKTGKPNYKLRKPISNITGSFSWFLHSFKRRLYIVWVFPVLTRDNFKCTICGSSNKIEVHHLKRYREIYEESINELNLDISIWKKWSKENISRLEEKIIEKHKVEIGKTVCEMCHSVIDPKRKRLLKKEKRKELIDHEKRYFGCKQL